MARVVPQRVPDKTTILAFGGNGLKKLVHLHSLDFGPVHQIQPGTINIHVHGADPAVRRLNLKEIGIVAEHGGGDDRGQG